jgi:ubiquinone/menaquinone biosynthesis C-methylase UbiE
LAGRIGGSPLPWNYVELAQAAVTEARAVLDIDTGGGETLGEVLGDIPDSIASSRTVVATEPYPPNLPVAAERLGPLGVDVRAQIDILPVEDGFADLVLNRHGALDAAEVARVLRPAVAC